MSFFCFDLQVLDQRMDSIVIELQSDSIGGDLLVAVKGETGMDSTDSVKE